MILIFLVVLIYIVYNGFTYYSTTLEERFYYAGHENFKPSGFLGHGMGIAGSLSMLVGVSVYMIRKRKRAFARLGKLKHWLEFHIFLCSLGPMLILFHTSFKFGGLASISFWSMTAVVVSGVIGRFIYIQIPRSIEGRELGLNEIRSMKGDFIEIMKACYTLDQKSFDIIVASTTPSSPSFHSQSIKQYFLKNREDRKNLRSITLSLKNNKLSRKQRSGILTLVKQEIIMNRRIERLQTMQNLFKYWHVAHLPFAIIMLIVMVIHVVVTIMFGYNWVF